MKLILASFALFGLVSSASATDATYRCGDGANVRAVFSETGPAGSVRLTFPGKPGAIALPQTISADGGRYADATTEFWIKGKTARLTRAGVTTDCTAR
jgi:membrane-bound inhibitor of C-type lysozyme